MLFQYHLFITIIANKTTENLTSYMQGSTVGWYCGGKQE